MNCIKLKNTLPNVFALQEIQSEIWLNDIQLDKGKIYLIEASSGAGKSSLCSFLTGFRTDFSGEILFDGNNINIYSRCDWVEVRKTQLSVVFQELRLFPELSALENVMIKNKLTNHKTQEQIENWFCALGLQEKINAKVAEMSFGQQQRVAMIRALSQPFDYLLADEPISHLDDDNAQTMSNIVLQEVRNQGASLIVTSIGKRMPLPYDKIFCL